MNDINSITLSGRLGRDAEFKFFQSGTEIMEVTMCFNTRKKTGDEWRDEPNWMTVKQFKPQGWMKPQLTKGRIVVVTGHIELDKWEKDGEKREKVCVFASQILPMRDKRDETQVPLTPNSELFTEEGDAWKPF